MAEPRIWNGYLVVDRCGVWHGLYETKSLAKSKAKDRQRVLYVQITQARRA